MFVVHNIIYGGYLKIDSFFVVFNTEIIAREVLSKLLVSRSLRQGLTGHSIEEFEIIPTSKQVIGRLQFTYDNIKTETLVPYFTVR